MTDTVDAVVSSFPDLLFLGISCDISKTWGGSLYSFNKVVCFKGKVQKFRDVIECYFYVHVYLDLPSV